MLFYDRNDAGTKLAERLVGLATRNTLVLALPRGGVPVAAPVARRLDAELDVMLVRKLGVPGHEELAMGAIAFGGARVINQATIAALEIPPEVVERATERELAEIERRASVYRGNAPPPRITGRSVIVVDDGLATGSTARAALEALRIEAPYDLILAVPVAPASTITSMLEVADRVECLATPEPFHAVGLWYRDFSQVSDEEVRELLARGRHRSYAEAASPP